MYKIGIDLGGTKTEIVLLSGESRKPIIRKRIPTNAHQGYGKILDNIQYLVQEVKAGIPSTAEIKIGLGIPGFVDAEGKTLCCNTQCLNGKNFRLDLESIFKQKVSIENDANCFALSEACYGAGSDEDLVLGIIIGTGMGGGLIFKKRIIPCLHGYMGEIGHISSDLWGNDCWCTQKGCHETYLSGSGLQEEYKKEVGEEITVVEIYKKFLKQDPKTTDFIKNWLQIFGKVMSNLILGIAPQKIVLGGGVSNLPLLYKEGVEITKSFLGENISMPKIVPNKMGDSSGVFGAALII
jgi:predicted NBD/HSP70 family sugar kinase